MAANKRILVRNKGFQKMNNLSLYLLSSNRSIQACCTSTRLNLIIGFHFCLEKKPIRKENSVLCTTINHFFFLQLSKLNTQIVSKTTSPTLMFTYIATWKHLIDQQESSRWFKSYLLISGARVLEFYSTNISFLYNISNGWFKVLGIWDILARYLFSWRQSDVDMV